MSILLVYGDSAPEHPIEVTRAGERMAEILATIGVRFERWSASAALPPGATQEQILDAYRAEIDRLNAAGGYLTADVVRMRPGHPEPAPIRAKFRAEHRHGEDEVRFFVEGSGSFYLHVAERVYQVVCEKDDLLSVPANTRHWFDMGAAPHFCAIRLFINPTGWVADFTGDPIATSFPSHDDALGRGAPA